MKRSLLAVAAIALSATAAQAQMGAPVRPVTFGVSAGASIPMGDLSSKDENTGGGAQTGFNVNGVIGYDAPSLPFGVRGELMYNRFAVDKDLTGGVKANWSILGGSVNAVLNVGSSTTARPYLIGGVGFAQVKASADDGGASASLSKSGFALNGGAGIRFPLGGLATFLEARYHYVNSKDEDTGFGNATFLPISFGILF